MAVTTGYVGSAAITWASSATATVSGQSIGTAAWDRIVLVAVTVEDNVTINSCTIDGVTATVGPQAIDTAGTPDNCCRFFYLPDPTGTTANIAVTLSASSTQTGRISVWAVTGAMTAHVDSNTNTGAAATLTLTGVTVPSGGAGFWVFNNATTATVVNWTNATERDDTSVANYRHSVADTTTAGTATITADGANAAQSIAGISFDQAPVTGWDLIPQYEQRGISASPNLAAIALIASGLIFAPAPPPSTPATPGPVTVNTTQIINRILYYPSYSTRPPFIPSNLTTSIEWLPKWPAPPRYSPPRIAAQPFVPKEAVLENTVTPDKWLQQWRGPRRLGPPKIGVQPFVPVAEQLTLPISVEWSLAGTKSLHYQSLVQPVFVPEAPSNLTTSLEWLPKWPAPPNYSPPTSLAQPFIPPVAAPSNLTTSLEWLPRWPAPPNYSPPTSLTQAFIPPAPAPASNLTTSLEWLPRWEKAIPTGTPDQSRQVFGFPYAQAAVPTGPVTVTTTQIINRTLYYQAYARGLEPPPVVTAEVNAAALTYSSWSISKSLYYPSLTQPVIVPAAADNTVTPDKWLPRWSGPPSYQPPWIASQPFVPKEAVLENTVTPDKWLFRFAKAVPVPKPIPTQPAYGFPYESIAIVVPSEQWWHQPLSRPAARPSVHSKPYQPFVPREATLENTIGNIAWHQPFYKAVPTPKPIATQPFFGFPYEFASNLTTSIEWLRPFDKAVPHGWPQYAAATFPAFPYEAAVTAVTIDQWLVRWEQPRRYQPPKIAAQPFVPKEATLENTLTGIAWLKPFYQAVPWPRPAKTTAVLVPKHFVNLTTTLEWLQAWRGPPRYRPPKLVAQPFVPIIELIRNTVTPDKWLQRWRGPPRIWPKWLPESLVYQKPEFVTGGPADEPERIACVPSASRTATVPELTRIAYAPDTSRIVDSNEHGENLCHDT